MNINSFHQNLEFNKRRNWAFVIGTLVNCIVYLYLDDITIFICRQVFLLTAFIIITFSYDSIVAILNDRALMAKTLEGKFPFLKLEIFFSAGFFFAFFLFIFPSLIESIPINLSLTVCNLYAVFIFYKFFCIYRTPEVSIKYNLVHAITVHGVNSLDFVKAILYCLYDTLKYLIAFFILIWLGPKLLWGVDYRSLLVNKIVCPLSGLQSDSEDIYSKGFQLIEDKPELKDSLTLLDGMTLDKIKVLKAYKSSQSIFSLTR